MKTLFYLDLPKSILQLLRRVINYEATSVCHGKCGSCLNCKSADINLEFNLNQRTASFGNRCLHYHNSLKNEELLSEMGQAGNVTQQINASLAALLLYLKPSVLKASTEIRNFGPVGYQK